MSESPVVADASSLIALNQIDRLDILQRLWNTIVVPPAVASEIAPSVIRPDWVAVCQLVGEIDPDILAAALGPGESEAISLTRELHAIRVVLDVGRRDVLPSEVAFRSSVRWAYCAPPNGAAFFH